MDSLRLGVAYHSNRLLSSVQADMKDIVHHHFNTVIHMFSHNDWVRCPSVMKDIFAYTQDLGLDFWVDNWGLMGAPGDPGHFLCYHPDSHRCFSDGTYDSRLVCLNSPEFLEWTKEWIDEVYECGGRKIFWDEPYLALKEDKFSCGCPRCRKLFAEMFNHEMPVKPDDETFKFQMWTINNYFEKVTAYAHEKGMENSVCVMLGGHHGISLDNIDELGKIETMDNIGSDPYWISSSKPERSGEEVYEFVYKNALKNINVCKEYNKGHNIWVQAYNNQRNCERNIVYAAEAAYDAGARNIFFWGYRGCEGNEYRAKCPEVSWTACGEAAMRIWQKENDKIISNARKKLELDK